MTITSNSLSNHSPGCV
uniref:Uncharacterized protein n=1 Tax=Anguilla anguilla TaxID=7936 RepID=A0A0E9XK07_ANGAN